MIYDKQFSSHSIPIFMAGGSQVLITPDGIVYATKGSFSAKASTHELEGPKSINMKMPQLNPYYFGYYILRDKDTQKILPNYPYQLVLQDGRKVIGRTNRDGETLLVNTTSAQEVKFIEPKEKEKKKTRQLFVAGSDQIKLSFEYIDSEE
ncbi:hypothetical protein [Acinetobacter gerneri]|uniref:hypothetical protein n=1 Tax=Acinetobacter gerneri TaxID=202952 RepID=UPI003212E0A5